MFRGHAKWRLAVFGVVAILAIAILANIFMLRDGGFRVGLDSWREGNSAAKEPEHTTEPEPQQPVVADNADPVVKVSDFSVAAKLAVFPKGFDLPAKNIAQFFSNFFEDNDDGYTVIKFNSGEASRSDSLLLQDVDTKVFNAFQMPIFDSFEDSATEAEACSNTEQTLDIGVSDHSTIDVSIESLVERIYRSQSDYVDELRPYFEKKYLEQVEKKTVHEHWWRFASSSVWLEQYGVHLMISRIIHSPSGARGSPILSLTYAQIFNEKWQELKDVSLIVPTNCPDKYSDQVRVGGLYYKKMHYPSVIQVPFFHDPEKRKSRFYGAEDPRILLVKNSAGYEEPLMVYNAYHRKILNKYGHSDHELSTKLGFYRSMWICWPWQFQRGKRNADDLALEYDGVLYNKAVELRREGIERKEKQKNWTPFIDYEQRSINKYDTHIYFVYRWTHLEVLKCELADVVDGKSKCAFAYRMDKNPDENLKVGEFRGGTELISANQIIEETSVAVSEQLRKFAENRQVWVGFARAHIRDCGCGGHMYRPNFVVLVKERNGDYKIDKVSSFLSLNVPMISWVPGSNDLCKDQSVFIPNGVSSWSFGPNGLDYLTLSFTLSDTTNDLIQASGLLEAIASQDRRAQGGFNDNNIGCALERSRHFCKEFGDAQNVLPRALDL